MASKETPMMKQYNEIKSQYSDCILFFRLGDFYEMFGDDAVIGAEILDITLTARTKSEDAIPMAGVPYHSAESYIAKLTSKGKKVAIAEQVSDPSEPGIVKREVVRVVTPGTNLSTIALEQKANQYVGSIAGEGNDYAVCFADVSTGELIVGTGSLEDIRSLVETYQPKELVACSGLAELPVLYDMGLMVSGFDMPVEKSYLLKHFGTSSLGAFGLDNELKAEVVGLNLMYLDAMLQTSLANMTQVIHLNQADSFDLDPATIYNLELFYTIRDFDRKNSLIAVIDKTVTAGGGRLLKRWLIRPLKSLNLLQKRLSHVDCFYNKDLKLLRSLLSETYDLERLVSRLSLGYGNPRDLIQVKQTLQALPAINVELNSELRADLPDMSNLVDLIEQAIVDEPPISKRDGGIFKDGYHAEADEYRTLLRTGKDFIAKHKADLVTATGIDKLKIGYNKVFGYYIEVSKAKSDLVPETFIRKQTLTNSERYITPELKEYEEKVLNASGLLNGLEERLFDELVVQILAFSEQLRKIAKSLAYIDVCSGLAELAKKNNYCKPELHEGIELRILDGRHPVLEQILEKGAFVPNNSCFDLDTMIKLITGPNMGGKSTYLRQTALIVLLAQIGSYVPARSAKIGLVDQIYSRVGASDNLAKGQSTFMVEMEETAYILRQATEKSLLILDEIGRGTSTYDGVSLAWSILEHIHNNLGARTLFATHYHELIEVVDDLDRAQNFSVAVEEDANGKAVLLHQIRAGAVSKSYGVHVAEKAGLPNSIIQRAESLLSELETSHQLEHAPRKHQALSPQPSLFATDPKAEQVRSMIDEIDVNNLTPLQALQKLNEIKADLNGG